MEKKDLPAIGIDLGGTKILAGLVANSHLVGEPVRVPTPSGPENIIKALLDIIADFQKEHLVLGVGIATAGIVDTESGAILGSTGNLPGWEGTALKHVIEERTALRTHVENDANAAAYGEARAAGLHTRTCSVMVTLGTGIGGGIILKGSLYRGAHYAGGEVGHIKISMENQRRCTCGLWDCWEAYGSGRGLLATALEMARGKSKDQSVICERDGDLTTKDVLEAAAAGDIIAGNALKKYHEHVAVGMSALCHVLDPDCFVISGGMSKFVDLKLIKELLFDRTLPRIAEKLEIYPSRLSEKAGMIGAAQIVLDAVNPIESMSTTSAC
ncbi:MAG: ROK family protein [Candidatus Obscuribacterales bacterium]|nr:ROK family protein [Candidatus Obscuribacterales bacterium]